MLLGGTLAECDRADDSRADYSGKHRRHGVNLQVITAPDGTLVWISPAHAGRVHDLTAARRHRITATCVRPGIPVLADRACQGADPIVAVPHRRKPGKNLTPKQTCANRAHSRLRWPAGRAIARIKTWPLTPQSPSQPHKVTSIAKAIVTLETEVPRGLRCPEVSGQWSNRIVWTGNEERSSGHHQVSTRRSSVRKRSG
ncbi:transposase family protein [Streptomyces sp. NPDC127051]|uniref:transposase family protein n=1 Tax=Streptomyces sp. NPDC127051 TaxID=3347119 RepID=UPI0036597B64